MGIAFSGASLGLFIMPTIVDILLNTYGLSGTFLFLSGFILNCAPPSLLLRKPHFSIKTPNKCDVDVRKRQSFISRISVNMEENNSQKCESKTKETEENMSDLTNGERLKSLSTQTLSDYCMSSTSESLDVDKIAKKSRGRREVDTKDLKEMFSLSSCSIGNSDRRDVFQKAFRSSSVQYERPFLPSKRIRTVSLENIDFNKGNVCFGQNCSKVHPKHDYHMNTDEINVIHMLDNSSDLVLKNIDSKSLDDKQIDVGCSCKTKSDNYNFPSAQFKRSSEVIMNVDSLEQSQINNGKENFFTRSGNNSSETKKKSVLRSFSIITDPMFILIAVSNAIHGLVILCITTIIVDFARDLQIGTSNEKYVLMALSVGDIIGYLCLGWITDRGLMSTTAFTALSFACQGLIIFAIVLSRGFSSLIILLTLYGLSEAGYVFIYPVILGQYIDQDKQAVAVASSLFPIGPISLAIPPLIGYFRDEVGSYIYIFHILATLSVACSLSWIFASILERCQRPS